MCIPWNLVDVLLLVGTILASAEAHGQTSETLTFSLADLQNKSFLASMRERFSPLMQGENIVIETTIDVLKPKNKSVVSSSSFTTSTRHVSTTKYWSTPVLTETTQGLPSSTAIFTSTFAETTTQVTLTTTLSTTIPTQGIDYSGWHNASNSHLYKLFETKLNYANAQKKCEGYRAILASKGMRNAALRSEILSDLRMGSSGEVWIGLTDQKVEGNWTWEDGERESNKSENWQSGQPDNATPGEDCVHLGRTTKSANWTKFNDNACSNEYSLLCET